MLTVAYHYDLVKTRFGAAAIIWINDRQGHRIRRILLPATEEKTLREILMKFPAASRKRSDLLANFAENIRAFMEGKGPSFKTSLLDMSHVPPFHRKVLRALVQIPKGRVRTYGEIAAKVGSPGGARAAGQGCASNPFPIVFPCHRVIRSDGSLGGFGGGLQLKQALLDMEGVRFDSAGKVKREFITP